MESHCKMFAWKVAAWVAAALLVQFLTTLLLGAPPEYVVSGILVLGALHIGLLERTKLPVGDGKMLKRGIALLLITFAVWLATDPDGEEKIPWQEYSEEILQAAQKGGRPVMIDFSSRNCGPCLDMERQVFSRHRVADAAKDFVAVRVDLTGTNAALQALAEKYGIEAFPTIVFLGADGKERRNLRLVGFENATFFTERVQQAR